MVSQAVIHRTCDRPASQSQKYAQSCSGAIASGGTHGKTLFTTGIGELTVKTSVGDANATLSGNLWRLTAPDGTYYVYGHLSGFAPGLAKGSIVYKGQLLGYVGDTGNPGPGNYHLHYEVHPGGGAAIDPLPSLRPLPAACTVYG